MSLSTKLSLIRRKDPKLASDIESQHGFLSKEQVEKIVGIDRFFSVLVRCNNGRFVCPAQNAVWFADLINESEKEWVRDMSVPA